MLSLIIDGYLNGTGIRNKYPEDFSYIEPGELGLTPELISKIRNWLERYWNESTRGYPHNPLVESLDKEGIEIANLVRSELKDAKVEYYSDAKMRMFQI